MLSYKCFCFIEMRVNRDELNGATAETCRATTGSDFNHHLHTVLSYLSKTINHCMFKIEKKNNSDPVK